MNWTQAMKDELVSCEGDEVRDFADRYGLNYENVSRRRRKLMARQQGELTIGEAIRKEKAKLNIQRDERAVADLVRRASMVEMVVDSLREAIIPIADFSAPSIYVGEDTGGDEEEAVLLLSDAQIGKKTKTYDSKVYAERMKQLAKAVIKITNIQRADHPIKRLNIFWLGDMPDGQLIYPTQAFHTDQNVVNQIFRFGLPASVDALASFATAFEEVDNYCVRGNHGRTGKFADETSNWDTVFYRAMELATREVDTISWCITDDWMQVVEVMNSTFLLTHGHQIKMYLNIPHYGITTKGMRWQGSVGAFDYLCLGHFHTTAMNDWNEWEAIINGTFVSDDEWVQEELGLKSQSKQTLFFVHPRKGITARYKIDLN